MRYLSLDNALKISGAAIFENDKLLYTGTIETTNSAIIEKRLGQIWEGINSLYNEYEFDYVFFEDCYKQPNMQTYQKLSMVKATILLWCYFNNIPCSCCEPSHWRKVLVDYSISAEKFSRTRAEAKQQAIDLVQKLYEIEVSSDVADAVLIGLAGITEKTKSKQKSAF